MIVSYITINKDLELFIAPTGDGYVSKLDSNDLSKLSAPPSSPVQPFLVFACTVNKDAAQLLLRETDVDVYAADANGVSPLEAVINSQQGPVNCISRSLAIAILSRFSKDCKKISVRELSALAVRLEANPTLDHGKELLHNILILNYSVDLKATPIDKDSLALFKDDTRKRAASGSAPILFTKPLPRKTAASVDQEIAENSRQYYQLRRTKCLLAQEDVRLKATKLQQGLTTHRKNILALHNLTTSLNTSYKDIHSSFAELRAYTGGQNVPDMQINVGDLEVFPNFFAVSCIEFQESSIILRDNIKTLTFLSTMTSKIIDPVTATPNPSPLVTPNVQLDKKLRRM